MDLSIIIPCYNCKETISKTIDSIAAQKTVYSFEVIFILDDRITDNTKDIIEQLSKNKIKNYKIITTSSHTCGLARNDGIRISTGNYIWFVDADDWIEEDNAIEFLIKNAYSVKANGIRFDFSGAFPCKTTPTVWRNIYKSEFIKKYMFDDAPQFEDNHLNKKLWTDPDFMKAYFSVDRIFYHYEWPRKNSLTGGLILNETEPLKNDN
jgi:glycosyltransferase involved in cell wall biosynthesis